MEFVDFGNTGLKASVAGLGCGGSSKLGLATGHGERAAIALVRTAIDMGVNLVDTAARYGTEDVVGKALADMPREAVIVSTKARIHQAADLLPPSAAIDSLEESLRRLRTDYVDIFHIHGVLPAHYDYVRGAVVPLLEKARTAGKIRFLGVTEFTWAEHGLAMMPRAVADDCWQSLMVACHIMHQKPADRVLRPARAKGIGTLLMYAVRSIFSRPQRLKSALDELASAGVVPRSLAESENPLGFLVHPQGARSLIDAAYRFARHETGASVVLTGTGDVEHLRANVASILSPALPAADVAMLRDLFGTSDGVGLDAAERPSAARSA